jgi:hypothetical protein
MLTQNSYRLRLSVISAEMQKMPWLLYSYTFSACVDVVDVEDQVLEEEMREPDKKQAWQSIDLNQTNTRRIVEYQVIDLGYKCSTLSKKESEIYCKVCAEIFPKYWVKSNVPDQG